MTESVSNENLETKIIEIAKQQFIENGFAETSMSDIAAKVGINRPGSGEKVQLEIFTEYLSGELSFPFDGVGVVVVGDEQDFFNLEGHEFLENVAVTLFPLVYFIQVYFFHDVLFCTKLKICWRNGKRK